MPTTSQTAAGGASPFAAAPPPRNSSAAATADAAAAAAAQTADTHMPDAAAKSTFTSQTQAAIEAADKAADQLPPRMSLTRGDSLAALQLPVHPDIAVFGWGRNDCGEHRSSCNSVTLSLGVFTSTYVDQGTSYVISQHRSLIYSADLAESCKLLQAYTAVGCVAVSRCRSDSCDTHPETSYAG